MGKISSASDPLEDQSPPGLHPLARLGEKTAPALFFLALKILTMARMWPSPLTDEAAEAQSGEVTGSSGGWGQWSTSWESLVSSSRERNLGNSLRWERMISFSFVDIRGWERARGSETSPNI